MTTPDETRMAEAVEVAAKSIWAEGDGFAQWKNAPEDERIEARTNAQAAISAALPSLVAQISAGIADAIRRPCSCSHPAEELSGIVMERNRAANIAVAYGKATS